MPIWQIKGGKMRPILGVVALLMGSAILLWVAYNVLIKMQPEARVQNLLPGIVVSGLLILVGLRWLQGKQAG